LDRHAEYIVEHLEDLPEIAEWTFEPPVTTAKAAKK
jgi:hypothetical protein